jgi:integrase
MERIGTHQQKQEQKSKWTKIGPCLYRHRAGVYYGLVKFKGKQVRRSLETQDLPLARRKLAAFKQDLEKTDPSLKARKFGDQAETYLKALTGAVSTRENAAHYIKKAVAHFGADTPVAKITGTDCRLWLAQHINLSASTRNQMLRALRGLFDMALDDRVIPSTPLAGITYSRRLQKLVRDTPKSEQFEAIVADLRSQKSNGHGRDDTADFVELSGRLGLGQAELTGICRKHIDLEAEEIMVLRKKTSTGFTIPIYPAARAIIERRLNNMEDDPNARLLPQDNCKKGLAAACKRLGFPNFTPRSLRRFFISTAIRRGVDVATVAAWQGHTDGGALILKVYNQDIERDHSQRMAKLLAAESSGDNLVAFPKEATA